MLTHNEVNNDKRTIPSTDQNTNNGKGVVMEKQIKITTNGIQRDLTIRMGFDNVSKAELLEWAFANRIIACQRALRECTDETINEFVLNGYEVDARHAGVKPMTDAERKAELAKKVEKMSDDEKQAMIELLMSQLG